MKLSLKWLAVLSALLMISACETPNQGDDTMGGSGMGGNMPTGGYDSMPTNAIPAGTPADFEANIGDRVYFGYDSSVLSNDAQATLQRQAQWLNQYGSYSLTVEGHCDERGTREYNIALGERRANAVRDYLVSLGVNAGRINVVSYGKERPAVIGSDDAAYAQNRRGVTVLE